MVYVAAELSIKVFASRDLVENARESEKIVKEKGVEEIVRAPATSNIRRGSDFLSLRYVTAKSTLETLIALLLWDRHSSCVFYLATYKELKKFLVDCTSFAGNEATDGLARLKNESQPMVAQCAAAPKIDDESSSQVVDLEILP